MGLLFLFLFLAVAVWFGVIVIPLLLGVAGTMLTLLLTAVLYMFAGCPYNAQRAHVERDAGAPHDLVPMPKADAQGRVWYGKHWIGPQTYRSYGAPAPLLDAQKRGRHANP